MCLAPVCVSAGNVAPVLSAVEVRKRFSQVTAVRGPALISARTLTRTSAWAS
jgi:hypothetical protein